MSYISLAEVIMMRATILLVCLTAAVGSLWAQTWEPVWKMTDVPYLTRPEIDNMAIVKAGFDTDGDGWGEFICAWTDEDTNAIMLYEATADNAYELKWSWVYPVGANSFASIAVGDLNNNGIVDIVTGMPSVVGVDPNPRRLWVFEWNGVLGENAYGVFNSGTNTYDASTAWNFDVPDNYDFRPYSMIIDDIDNDAKNELIVGARQASAGPILREIVVAAFDGDYLGFGSWDVEYRFSQPFGGSLYNVTIGDLDSDGNKELHAFVWNSFTMRIIECTGDKQYNEAFSVDLLYGQQGIDYGSLDAVRTVDVNGDNSNEMFIATTEDPNKLFVVSGISDLGTMDSTDIKEFFTIPAAVDGGFRSMHVADPDSDGYVDLLIAGEREGRIYDLEYKGTGDPADSANWDLRTIFNIWDAGAPIGTTPRLFYGHPAGDMDRDGKSEYVFINYSPDYTSWADDVPLWVIEMSSTTEVQHTSKGVPEGFDLLQNYPNPFNPSTIIPYRLKSRSSVRLEVYDVQGRQVALLVHGERDAGYYEVSWNPTLPSGSYVYRLSVSALDGSGTVAVLTRSMVLVK